MTGERNQFASYADEGVPASGHVYVAEGVIEVRGRPRRPARGTARPQPLSDIILVPWWEDNERGSEWDTVTINGHQWEGLAKIAGKGIGRKLDTKSRAGSDGARIVDKGYEPGKFDVTFQLWTEDQLNALGALIPAIHPRGTNGRPSAAVDIYHPVLHLAGIARAVVENVGLLQPGSVVGVWELKVSFIEFRQPAPRPVRAVTRTTLADVQTAFPAPRDNAGAGPRPSATNANP